MKIVKEIKAFFFKNRIFKVSTEKHPIKLIVSISINKDVGERNTPSIH